MSYKYDSKRDELYVDGTFGSATSNLLRAVGGWGNISGPSLFMLRMLVSGTTTALAFGITSSVLSATLYGTASIPWILGSTLGFIIGNIGVYRDSLSKALLALDLYPRLLQLHLDVNFPSQRFRTWRVEQLRAAEFSRSWTMRSMLVVSYLTAQPALDAIVEARERVLVEEASAVGGEDAEAGNGGGAADVRFEKGMI